MITKITQLNIRCDNCGLIATYMPGETEDAIRKFAKNYGWLKLRTPDGETHDLCCTNCLLEYRQTIKNKRQKKQP